MFEGEEGHAELAVFSGLWYTLGSFGDLTIGLEYYIDSLTLAMFMMVTLIATCIHVFALGYMSDELTDDYVDHQVHAPGGGHFHRPGRYSRFFAYLSLFSFSMLGIVISGSILMVFVFWELVGVTSYLLIGFYFERHSASTAANKAFIMNRVGDFGFLIGMMVVWTYFGTFSFGGLPSAEDPEHKQPGLFAMVSDQHGHMHVEDTEAGAVVHLQSGEAHEEHARRSRKKPARPPSPNPRGRFPIGCSSWRVSGCLAAASARVPSSRCKPGCRTRWKAPRRSRLWCTRPRWSRRACI